MTDDKYIVELLHKQKVYVLKYWLKVLTYGIFFKPIAF